MHNFSSICLRLNQFIINRVNQGFHSKNFIIDELQCNQYIAQYIKKQLGIEVITKDYTGSLMHILSVFKDHRINLSCLETRRLNKQQKISKVLFKLTFDKVNENQLSNFIDDLERRFDNVKLQSDDEVPSVAWYPRSLNDLRNMDSIKLDVKDEINQDHPQFKDIEYRKRRDYIAQTSASHLVGDPVPLINYTEQEQKTWRHIYRRLKEEHQGVLSKRFQINLEKTEKALGYLHQIPQLKDIEEYLKAETGFRVKATHGILNQRDFLNALGHKVFCCTQYIRHHDTPEYTPEPDIVHELVGHVPMFADREVAQISQEIGIQSCGALNEQVSRLGAIYWYTVEFGAHRENGSVKAYGAGIASSIDECQNFPKARFEKLNPFIHADQQYPIQTVQPVYMYSESFEDSLQSIIRFGESLQKPFKTYYDQKENQVIQIQPSISQFNQIKSDRVVKTYTPNDSGPKF